VRRDVEEGEGEREVAIWGESLACHCVHMSGAWLGRLGRMGSEQALQVGE
jgi:hypothetical protein